MDPRKYLLQALAAYDCEHFVVPVLQMPTKFEYDLTFDAEAKVSKVNGSPYLFKVGMILAANFCVPESGVGVVGASEGPTDEPWPRVIWLSADPGWKPLTTMATGFKPELEITGLKPGQFYWLNCFSPWMAQTMRYWGRKA